jgi:hypothetical protein
MIILLFLILFTKISISSATSQSEILTVSHFLCDIVANFQLTTRNTNNQWELDQEENDDATREIALSLCSTVMRNCIINT